MKENTGALHVQLPVDVATFLLNEKRVDIHTLETRLKVTVMLIPNIHLETPNYSIARLRHDELNRSDAAEPSYKMATMPESDEDAAAASAALLPIARLEAAVKSIAPAQRQPTTRPAALVPPPVGMFDRIFGWFKKGLADEPADTPEPVAESKPRERTSPRSERPRERKSPAARRPDTREPREAKPAREPREPREPRTERVTEAGKTARPPRPPKQARAEKPLDNEIRPVTEAPSDLVPGEAREPRTRRGRGGRGRNREERPQQAAALDTAPNEASAEATPGNSSVTPYNAVIESAAPRMPAPDGAAVQAASVPSMPPQASMPSAQQALALETRPVQSGNTPQAVLVASTRSEKDLQQVETQGIPVSGSDVSDAPRGDRPRRRRRPSTPAVTEPTLQQVETAVASAPQVQTDSASPPHPTRRRQRPSSPVVNEPLIQVETGNPP